MDVTKSIPGLSNAHCELAAKICGALAHAGRYRIVSECVEATRSAEELRGKCGMSKSQLSQHTKILSEAGLIQAIPEGKYVRYEARSDAARTLRLAVAAAAEHAARFCISVDMKKNLKETQ